MASNTTVTSYTGWIEIYFLPFFFSHALSMYRDKRSPNQLTVKTETLLNQPPSKRHNKEIIFNYKAFTYSFRNFHCDEI